MNIRSLTLAFFVLGALFSTSCRQGVPADDVVVALPDPAKQAVPLNELPAKGVIDVNVATGVALLKSGEIRVLDVRTPGENGAMRIDGAVTLIDIKEEGFEEAVAKLDHSKPYLVHCAAGIDGGRSRKAVDAVLAAGAEKVYHLDGGVNAWFNEMGPVKLGPELP